MAREPRLGGAAHRKQDREARAARRDGDAVGDGIERGGVVGAGPEDVERRRRIRTRQRGGAEHATDRRDEQVKQDLLVQRQFRELFT